MVIGKPEFLAELGYNIESVQNEIKALREQGKTVICIGAGGKLLGIIGLLDNIRDEAKEVIDKLKRIGIEPVMLTGDNWKTAKYIASKV